MARRSLCDVVALSGLLSAVSLASCTMPEQEVRLKDFGAFTVHQREPLWCWAACAEMVARHNGVEDVDQAEIAARIHGHEEDGKAKVAAASRYEIYRALCPGVPATPFDAVWAGLER